ncbi:MAG: GNAT family N-acetyltransferase [Bacteroidota bacterium]
MPVLPLSLPESPSGISYSLITNAADPDFPAVVAIYLSSFPANERMPVHIMEWRVNSGLSVLLVGKRGDEVISMCLLWYFSNSTLVQLDYFAVAEPYRNQNLGGEFFNAVCHYFAAQGKQLLIEVENPDFEPERDLKKRRINFYLRHGAALLANVWYTLPAFTADEPAKMRLMVAPAPEPGSVSRALVKTLIERTFVEIYHRKPEDTVLIDLLDRVPAEVEVRTGRL